MKRLTHGTQLFGDNETQALYNRLQHYEDLEESGKLLEIPCKTVWFICDKNTEYATVMSKSIEHLTVDDVMNIDKKGHYWSDRSKALAEMKKSQM